MRLSKRQFCEAVDTFEKMVREEEELIKVLGIKPEWKPGEWVNHYYDLIEDLSELEDDPIYGNDLAWFCFEVDFGKKTDLNKIFDTETSRTWTIKSADILYDWITRDE